MNYEEFKCYVRGELSVHLGKEVEIRSVEKNNSVRYDALTVNETDGICMTPAIYLEEYYRMYRSGVCGEDVVFAMCEFYRENAHPTLDVSILTNYERVKDRIIYRLIGQKYNRELLKKVPYKKLMDLAVVFYVSFEGDEPFHAELMINAEIAKMWNVTADELFATADKNTPRIYPAVIDTLFNCMKRLETEEQSYPYPIESCDINESIYVVTNKSSHYGATTLLYEDAMKGFRKEHGCNYYAVPSSVHEILLVPDQSVSEEYMNTIIEEINQTTLLKEEILSDHVYVCKS